MKCERVWVKSTFLTYKLWWFLYVESYASQLKGFLCEKAFEISMREVKWSAVPRFILFPVFKISHFRFISIIISYYVIWKWNFLQFPLANGHLCSFFHWSEWINIIIHNVSDTCHLKPQRQVRLICLSSGSWDSVKGKVLLPFFTEPFVLPGRA